MQLPLLHSKANSGSDVIVHFPAFDLIWSFLKENGPLAYIV